VPKGKYQGTHIGRLAGARAEGNFDITSKTEKINTNYKYCRIIQHADGYNYTIGDAVTL